MRPQINHRFSIGRSAIYLTTKECGCKETQFARETWSDSSGRNLQIDAHATTNRTNPPYRALTSSRTAAIRPEARRACGNQPGITSPEKPPPKNESPPRQGRRILAHTIRSVFPNSPSPFPHRDALHPPHGFATVWAAPPSTKSDCAARLPLLAMVAYCSLRDRTGAFVRRKVFRVLAGVGRVTGN